jgi:hypothetical protein
MSVSTSLDGYHRENGLTTSDPPEHFCEPPSALAPSLGMSLTTSDDPILQNMTDNQNTT